MSKFIPGPWKVEKDTDGVEEFVYITDGECVICDIKSDILDSTANLIAAAPELLAVVELIIKEWEAPTEGVAVGTLIGRLSQYSIDARAALAKARGES